MLAASYCSAEQGWLQVLKHLRARCPLACPVPFGPNPHSCSEGDGKGSTLGGGRQQQSGEKWVAKGLEDEVQLRLL